MGTATHVMLLLLLGWALGLRRTGMLRRLDAKMKELEAVADRVAGETTVQDASFRQVDKLELPQFDLENLASSHLPTHSSDDVDKVSKLREEQLEKLLQLERSIATMHDKVDRASTYVREKRQGLEQWIETQKNKVEAILKEEDHKVQLARDKLNQYIEMHTTLSKQLLGSSQQQSRDGNMSKISHDAAELARLARREEELKDAFEETKKARAALEQSNNEAMTNVRRSLQEGATSPTDAATDSATDSAASDSAETAEADAE